MLSDTLDRTDDGAFAAAVEAAATSTATSTRASLKGFSTVSFGALISAAVTVTVNPGSMPLATTAQRTAFVATIQNTLCQGITRPCVANIVAFRRQLLGEADRSRALASNARLTVSREYYTSQSSASIASLVGSALAANGGSVVSSTLTSLSSTISITVLSESDLSSAVMKLAADLQPEIFQGLLHAHIPHTDFAINTPRLLAPPPPPPPRSPPSSPGEPASPPLGSRPADALNFFQRSWWVFLLVLLFGTSSCWLGFCIFLRKRYGKKHYAARAVAVVVPPVSQEKLVRSLTFSSSDDLLDIPDWVLNQARLNEPKPVIEKKPSLLYGMTAAEKAAMEKRAEEATSSSTTSASNKPPSHRPPPKLRLDGEANEAKPALSVEGGAESAFELDISSPAKSLVLGGKRGTTGSPLRSGGAPPESRSLAHSPSGDLRSFHQETLTSPRPPPPRPMANGSGCGGAGTGTGSVRSISLKKAGGAEAAVRASQERLAKAKSIGVAELQQRRAVKLERSPFGA